MAFTHHIFDSKGRHYGFDDDEDKADTIAHAIGGFYELEEVSDVPEFPYDNKCPYCGSYEGDATECPECGHGQ